MCARGRGSNGGAGLACRISEFIEFIKLIGCGKIGKSKCVFSKSNWRPGDRRAMLKINEGSDIGRHVGSKESSVPEYWGDRQD